MVCCAGATFFACDWIQVVKVVLFLGTAVPPGLVLWGMDSRGFGWELGGRGDAVSVWRVGGCQWLSARLPGPSRRQGSLASAS